MNDLLKLAIDAHGGQRRREQTERFRVAASITGAIWTLKGQPSLLDGGHVAPVTSLAATLACEPLTGRGTTGPFGRIFISFRT